MITADFTNPADLTQLDDHEIDTVVHLAAVTGGSPLAEALRVNVAGTHTLLDYCMARGVRRIVLASSIAATGCLSPDFRPRRLPIDDDHEFDALDAYGFSKSLVEELASFLGRVEPELDITLFRIGAVQPEDAPEPDDQTLERMTIPFTQLGTISAADTIAALVAAVERPVGPGVRRANLVGRSARSPLPTAATLRQVLGDRADGLDLSHFEQPGHEQDSVFAVDRLAELFDCRPR